jgi:hypothetical protein
MSSRRAATSSRPPAALHLHAAAPPLPSRLPRAIPGPCAPPRPRVPPLPLPLQRRGPAAPREGRRCFHRRGGVGSAGAGAGAGGRLRGGAVVGAGWTGTATFSASRPSTAAEAPTTSTTRRRGPAMCTRPSATNARPSVSLQGGRRHGWLHGRVRHWPLPHWLGVVQDLMAFVDSRDEVPLTRLLPRFPIPRVSSLPAARFWVV